MHKVPSEIPTIATISLQRHAACLCVRLRCYEIIAMRLRGVK